MFLPSEHFYAAHKSLFFGFALIVTDHELLVFSLVQLGRVVLYWSCSIYCSSAGLKEAAAAVAIVEKKKKKNFSYPTMGGVILRLGTLPEPWESENTSEDLRHS